MKPTNLKLDAPVKWMGKECTVKWDTLTLGGKVKVKLPGVAKHIEADIDELKN